ncbi:hypothetical protein LCGC14_0565650 [marine sediment metagenome]|uniref:Uncharacterized protein n=1 Tax=marine sediment metagenome TaxID=412755 RepID=A0A0F9UTX8_9ZZZZ
MNFGVITQGDIATELASRGIRVGVPPAGVPPPAEPVISPPPVVSPPEAPQQPITVLPRGTVEYEPYIPIYPPPAVTPEDVTEEIVPYVTPSQVIPQAEKKGLDKGLLILIAITAFALMALSKPTAGQKRPRPAPDQRRGSTRRRY